MLTHLGQIEKRRNKLNVVTVMVLVDVTGIGYALNALADDVILSKRLMKLLYITHKKIEYEFRLLEQAKVIQITKGISNPFEELTYEMLWKGNKFHCNCPGSKFHGKCWHSEMINLLCQQPSINEPWTELAEEAGLI